MDICVYCLYNVIKTFTIGLDLHLISVMGSLSVSIFLFQCPPKAIVYKTVLLCPFLNQLTLIF